MTGVLLAGAGATGYGLASVAQGSAARGSASALRTVVRPAYVAGTALDLLAWLCSLAALRSLPVFAVQAVAAGSVAVTAVAGRVLLGTRLRRRDVVAIAITTAALGVVAAAPVTGRAAGAGTAAEAGLVAAAVVLPLAAWRAARHGTATGSATGTALLAGLAFGGAALCSRALVARPVGVGLWGSAGGKPALLGDPLLWALAAFGATGALAYAHALGVGDAARVTALLWTAEVTVPAALGMLLLGDAVRPGWLPWTVPALAAAVAAAAVLASAPPSAGRAAVPTSSEPPPAAHPAVTS